MVTPQVADVNSVVHGIEVLTGMILGWSLLFYSKLAPPPRRPVQRRARQKPPEPAAGETSAGKPGGEP